MPPRTINLSVGVTDADGATGSSTVPITLHPPALTVSATVTPDNLRPGESAILRIDATGGSPPYTYTATASEGTLTQSTTNPAEFTYTAPAAA